MEKKKSTPKELFLMLSPEVQQEKLMETAMRIMDIFCDMCYCNRFNPYKLEMTEFMQKLDLFSGWAREYEYAYYESDLYTEFWLEHTETIFTKKLMDEFGGEI